MREFVKFVFNNDICFFILCFLLTFTPVYGIMCLQPEKKKDE